MRRSSLLIISFMAIVTARCTISRPVEVAPETAHHAVIIIDHPQRFRTETYVNAMVWSPDSRYLAASDQRGHRLHVWDVTTGSERFSVPNSAGATRGLAFTRDGKFVLGSVSLHPGYSFSIWDARTGEFMRDVPGPERTRAAVGNSMAQLIAASPDGLRIAVIFGGSRFFGLYDSQSWKLETVVQYGLDQVLSIGFSPDGKHLVLGGYSGRIYLFDALTGDKLATFQADPNQSGHIQAVAFGPDGLTLAIGSSVNDRVDSHQLRLWNENNHTLLRAYETGLMSSVDALSWSPDGKYLVTAGYSSDVRVWDATTSHQLQTITSDSAGVDAVQFSPDGRRLAYGGAGGVTVLNVSP